MFSSNTIHIIITNNRSKFKDKNPRAKRKNANSWVMSSMFIAVGELFNKIKSCAF